MAQSKLMSFLTALRVLVLGALAGIAGFALGGQ